MGTKVVSNSGPILHLTEINCLDAFNIFSNLIIPKEVYTELSKANIKVPKNFKIIDLNGESKDFSKLLINQNDLDLGESSSIALTLQENADIFLTDDLDARIIAKNHNIEVHGTIGIILRAFKEKIFDKNSAIDKIRSLKENSSLYITSDLIKEIISSIEGFKD